jgi:hypothetical protein
VTLLALWAGPLVDGHVHKAPHSGVIAHAGAYHLELVPKDRVIQVWLLDQRERIVPPASGATLSLDFDRPLSRPVKGARSIRLQWATDHFEASFGMEPITGFTARAHLFVAGQRLRATFRVTLLDLRDRLDDRLDMEGEKLDDSNVDSLRKSRD